MYQLYILSGKNSIRAYDDNFIEDIKLSDIDVYGFKSRKEGYNFIKNISTMYKDYRWLTQDEYMDILVYSTHGIRKAGRPKIRTIERRKTVRR